MLKPLNGGPRVIDARMRFAERAMSDPPAEPVQAKVYLAWPWFQIRRRYAYVKRQRALGRDMRVYTSYLLRDSEKLGGLNKVKIVEDL